MEYILKPATPADLQTVLTWVDTPESMKLWAGPALTFPPQPKITWREIGATDENSFALVHLEGKVVGFGQTLLREPDRVHLARIIVSPAARGKGLGRILCQELLRVGVECYRATTFTLNVYRNNAAALNLYKSLGFTVVSEDLENDWYGMCLHV